MEHLNKLKIHALGLSMSSLLFLKKTSIFFNVCENTTYTFEGFDCETRERAILIEGLIEECILEIMHKQKGFDEDKKWVATAPHV